MSLLTGLRRLSRSLPIAQPLLHRLRGLAGLGFRLGAWLQYGRIRRPARPAAGPICVVGFHGSVLGIGEAARAMSSALRLAGAEVIDWDISPLFGHDLRLDGGYQTAPPAHAGAMLIFINPRELVQLMAMTGGAPFKDRFCAGCWAWELQSAPRSWRAGMGYVDEVWACSRFVADAVAARAPPGLPSRVLPHPISATGAAPDRAGFGLPPGAVAVLTAFDVRSGFARKNPLAAIRAFRRANAGGTGVMICKAAGVEGAPEQMAQLRAEIGDSRDVRLMEEWLTGPRMSALVASCDIVLSLHRSEGFGLLPAQAMAMGKAVVATGWSGNLDFMTAEDSALVDYSLTPVRDPQGLYAAGYWAAPNIEDAAAKLKRLMEDPEARTALGARAAAAIAEKLDPLRLGRLALAWLGQDRP
jgi:glycosyltransferase involved in cell wall biosynthesis